MAHHPEVVRHRTPMEVLSWPEAEVPLELRVQVVALQDQAWPAAEASGPAPWHDQELHPIEMLLVDDGVVLAALDILSKEIEHGGEPYAASGLSTVVTATDRRGQGHGSALVRAAREAVARSGADLGIFTCDTPLRGFYERCGWQVLKGTVLIGGTPDDPFPSDRFDKVTLAAFFSERATRAAASFVGARIGLYSGAIDRLW
jgi:aminoglycoside 2'-N-acetyltransferase I